MANIPKVPREEFEAIIKALLNRPPLPLAEIPRTCETKAKAQKRAAKKPY